MGGYARAWGAKLPLRRHLQVLFDQAARGVPVLDSIEPFCAVAALALLFFSLAVLRLGSVARNLRPPPGEAAVHQGSARTRLGGALMEEHVRALLDRGPLGLFAPG